MAEKRLAPRHNLAKNLAMLLAETGLSEEACAKAAGVAKKTVNNVLHGRHNPGLDQIGKIAGVFGLTDWQMILPNLRRDMARSGKLDVLVQNYMDSDASDRAHIERTAEMTPKNKRP